MKKLAICLLALLMAVSFVSCGGDATVPDGYQLASNSTTCSYDLFVPETWIVKSGTDTNYTFATVGSGDKSNVSLMVVGSVDADTIEKYWDNRQSEYETLFGAITVEEEGVKTTVGSGEKAIQGVRYVFTASYKKGETVTDYKFMQVFFYETGLFTGTSFYVFTYTATAAEYDGNLEAVNSILSYFSFR